MGARDEAAIVAPITTADEHVLRRILKPAINEVSMKAVALAKSVAARKLEGGIAVPAIGSHGPYVVPRGDAELGHPLRVLGTRVGSGVAEGVLRDVVRVDAVREEEQEAEMLLTGLCKHLSELRLPVVGLLAVSF